MIYKLSMNPFFELDCWRTSINSKAPDPVQRLHHLQANPELRRQPIEAGLDVQALLHAWQVQRLKQTDAD